MTGRSGGGTALRVVQLVDGLGVSGGGERFAHELAVNLDSRRFERIVCISRWSSAARRGEAEALERLRDAGVEVVELRRRSAGAVWAWRPLIELLRERRVDILHSHKFGSNVWGALWSSLARTPVFVAHEQTWSYQGRPLRRFLDRELIARRAGAFICVSAEDRRRMIEIERIAPEKIVLVANAISSRESSGGRDLRVELGIGADDPIVGTVCALRPQKALDVMLRAIALLRDEFERLRLVIVGDGPERERLEALARALGLGQRVAFLGQRSDVPDLLGGFDVAALSSDFEGTPLAVMEYMAAGLPIVATEVGGVPEMIDDRVHGRLVPPQDPQALARAIGELLRDRTAAAALGERARERQRREFDVSVAVRRIESLYERLVAGCSPADPGP